MLSACCKDGAKENSHRLTVERNRIHDCGRDPSDNNGIAIQIMHASEVLIRNNFIYDNVDDAIHLFPAAQHSLIINNTIDGNGAGVKFGGSEEYDDTMASSNNIVEKNIITNSIIDWNIQDYWGPPGHEYIGRGNIARLNCVLGTNRDGYYNINGGVLHEEFAAEENLVADPQYIDRKGKDFRIAEGSPCAGKGVSPS